MNNIKEILSDLELEVINKRALGKTLVEIANTRNLSREGVRVAEKRAIEKILELNDKNIDDELYLYVVKKGSHPTKKYSDLLEEVVDKNMRIDERIRSEIIETIIDKSEVYKRLKDLNLSKEKVSTIMNNLGYKEANQKYIKEKITLTEILEYMMDKDKKVIKIDEESLRELIGYIYDNYDYRVSNTYTLKVRIQESLLMIDEKEYVSIGKYKEDIKLNDYIINITKLNFSSKVMYDQLHKYLKESYKGYDFKNKHELQGFLKKSNEKSDNIRVMRHYLIVM